MNKTVVEENGGIEERMQLRHSLQFVFWISVPIIAIQIEHQEFEILSY